MKAPPRLSNDEVTTVEVFPKAEARDLLEDKLGPMLLQFPYFNRSAFNSVGTWDVEKMWNLGSSRLW